VWSIDGDVPDGLTLSEDGLLCGTPKKAGQLDVLVRVEDSRGATAMAMFSLRIDARLSIATTSLPHGIIRESYSAALESSGGARPVVWQVSSGQLPPGLTLDPSGTISGTPSTAGAYVFTVEVDDSGPQKVSKPLSIRITDGKLPEAEGDGCGCQAAPKARGGAMGMLLLALLTASRPRRRATTRAGG
jgi:MYXO-CTERM domain-containing protein